MIKEKSLKARELKSSGAYNCAQSVACVFCQETGMSHDTMTDITAAFGTGMGNTKGTCGALVGAGVVLGLIEHDRIKSRGAMKRVMDAFEQRNGATICRELKGIGTGKPLRHCNDCVADAAEILATYLAEKQ